MEGQESFPFLQVLQLLGFGKAQLLLIDLCHHRRQPAQETLQVNYAFIRREWRCHFFNFVTNDRNELICANRS